MAKAAKIINKFWKEFYVPEWKAKKMMLDWEITDFSIEEVEKVKNFDKPQTQRDFERWFDKPNEAENLKETIREMNNQMRELKAMVTERQPIEVAKVPETPANDVTLEELKAIATEKGIIFSPNIGKEKLLEKLNK